jgi:predicted PurR-regulated permease PerM
MDTTRGTVPPTGPAVEDGGIPPPGHETRTVMRIEVAGRTIWQTIGAILATILLLGAADAASTLLAMVALSFFFSLALDPAVRWLVERYAWRRGAAVGVIYVAGALFLVALVFVLVPAIGTLADVIAESGDEWVASLNAWTSSTFGFPLADDSVASGTAAAGERLGEFSDEAFGAVLGIASAGVSMVFNLATIAMFTFYFTADAPGIKRAVLRLFHPTTQVRIGWTWDQAIVQTGGYFYSRVILMAINGTGFFVTMMLVGLPLSLALSLALFGGFVSVFIPAIGTYLGGAVPILVTLALRGLVPGLIVLGYVLAYQQVENYWLSPKISADTMSLNGGVAFGAALAGGAIAGPVGAFVALPVAALITSVIANYGRSYEVVYESEHDRPAAKHDGKPPVGSVTPTLEPPRARRRPRLRRSRTRAS